MQTYEKISESFDHTIQNTIDTLEAKIVDIRNINVSAKGGTTTTANAGGAAAAGI